MSRLPILPCKWRIYIYAICKAKWEDVTCRKPLIWRIYIRQINGFWWFGVKKSIFMSFPAGMCTPCKDPMAGLAWPGLAWPGLACPGLAWPGLAWPGLAWDGPQRFTGLQILLRYVTYSNILWIAYELVIDPSYNAFVNDDNRWLIHSYGFLSCHFIY